MKTSRTIKIASRSSKLALWQSEAVKSKLEELGCTCQIVTVESTGDFDLTQPIYALGISGVFTKQLDIALLNGQADIAVHSLKDVPTRLAEGILLTATLERGAYQDVAVLKDKGILGDVNSLAVVATGSLRRKAQWLAKYPAHQVVPVRGNVQTRLNKLEASSETDVMIFAKAGLERLGLLADSAIVLDWMLPAPAQGIIGVVCREDDNEMKEICGAINHLETMQVAEVERQFMQTLLAGCSVPVGALAQIAGDKMKFTGGMHSFDGTRHFKISLDLPINEWTNAGKTCAEKLLQQPGAGDLLSEIRNLPK